MMVSGRADYMDGGMNGPMEMGMVGNMTNGRGAYRPPDRPRGICRDYHSVYHVLSVDVLRSCMRDERTDNGYCARGAFCKYSHGDDVLVCHLMVC